VNTSDDELVDHQLHQMSFEQYSTDDDRLKLNPRLKGLNKLSYPLDPKLPRRVPLAAASLQPAYAIQNVINPRMLSMHPPYRTEPAVRNDVNDSRQSIILWV